MEKPKILHEVALTAAHNETSQTRHIVGGEVARRPASLRIVQYDGEQGCYLFGCDESGNEVTDTWHESVEAAMGQAEFEFGVTSEEWTR